MKLRIQFEKLGPIRFTSHKDVVRIFQRCFAAGGVPIHFSEGFHPHMRMSFGPPLKTGWESHAEYMDINVSQPVGEFTHACNELLPAGLRVTHVAPLSDRALKLANDLSAVELEITIQAKDAFTGDAPTNGRRNERLQPLAQDINARFSQPEADDTPRVTRAEVCDEGDRIAVKYTSTMIEGRIVVPAELVGATIGDPESFEEPLRVTRIAQYVERSGELVSPVSKGVIRATS